MTNIWMLMKFWYTIRLVKTVIWLNLKVQAPGWGRQDKKLREHLAFLTFGRALIHAAIAIERWTRPRT